MKRSQKWRFVAIAFAVTAAVAIASPALGGPSLKKLVKKEVAKQISRATGPQGAQGPQGPQGIQGDSGSPGISGLEKVEVDSVMDSSSRKDLTATCPAGKRVIGSGADISAAINGSPPDQLTSVVIDKIEPSSESTVPGTVDVTAVEVAPFAQSWWVTAFALCANVS